MRPVELRAAGASQTGTVRDENQDFIRISEDDPDGRGRLAVLADGMGGYAHGSVASRTAVETLFSVFYAGPPRQARQNLRQAIQHANLEVHRAAQTLGAPRMGTTLTALHLAAGELAIAHVGDCRAYLVRNGQARCLTQDHSVVGDLVRLKVLAPEQVRTHARRSILSKSLGLGLFVQPDFIQLRLQADDTLIVCSDGVWTMIQDDEFAGLAQAEQDPHALSRQIVEVALARGSDDNASAISVHIRHPGSADGGARRWHLGWPAAWRRQPAAGGDLEQDGML